MSEGAGGERTRPASLDALDFTGEVKSSFSLRRSVMFIVTRLVFFELRRSDM
jgi:hypothetical protein